MKALPRKALASTLALLIGLGPVPALAALAFEERSIDGNGNNTAHTTWGAVDTQLIRLTSVDYSDDISEPRGGTGAVSPRAISNAVVAQPADIKNARGLSDMFWQWGQFIDHDIDLTDNGTPAEPYPIAVPAGDPYFDPFNTGTQTIGFNRSVYDASTGIDSQNPRQQINQITAYLDASNVYGSDQTRADALRTFTDGTLKTSTGDLLPFNTPNLPNAMSTSSVFFLAGDVRANEQPGLTAMHTLFVREHNRIAAEVAAANPSYTDEEIYQTARRKVAALIQAITYNEFLPALFGTDMPTYTGYDSSVNAGIANEFSTAAFRLGHSMISPEVLRLGADGLEAPEGHLDLVSGFFNPTVIQSTGIDSILRGMPAQVMQEVDSYEIDTLRNFLFGPPGAGGFDLASLNIQRGRDHGLPGFNQVRRDLGLTPYTDFDEITTNATISAALETVYGGDIEAIDLWVGGLSETHMAGASVGETFGVIILDQFTRLRDGDRFWYQREYTGAELSEIQNTRLRDVIERNSGVENLQEFVMFAEYPEADIYTETSVPALTLSGSLITAEVTIGNNGPLTASGVTVTVTVPANTVFDAGSSDSRCQSATGSVLCTIDPLSAGDATALDVSFEASSALCSSTVNIRSVGGAEQQDGTLGNNSSEDQTFFACPGPNDLDLELSLGSSVSAERGSSFTALASVINNGPATASGASVTVSIPTGTTVNAINHPSCSVSSGSIVCTDLVIANGNTEDIEVEYTIDENSSCPRTAGISATVSAGQQQDYFGANNSDTSNTAVECEPENDLTISLRGPSHGNIGDPVTYEATVQNNGPATATTPTVTVPLKTGMTFSASNSTSSCSQNGAEVICTLSPIADGDSTTVEVAFVPLVSLACGTDIEFTASVTSAEKELNALNNESGVVRTEMVCGSTAQNSSNPQAAVHDTDTVGNSQSPGSTRGKGTNEAMMVLALLCQRNGMDMAVGRNGHYRLTNNASALAGSVVGSDQTEIRDGFTQAERNIICGMKSYMENQDPRNRKTDEFKDWLIDRIAHDLHRTEQEIRKALESDTFCQ